MDESLRQIVDETFDEFIEDFATSCSDIDRDILNYSNKYFEDHCSQQFFCMEVGLQLMVYQLGKYLAVFNPEEQGEMIDKIESKLRRDSVRMHAAWLKHTEEYRK